MSPRLPLLLVATIGTACGADDPVTTDPLPNLSEPDAGVPDAPPARECEMRLGSGVRSFQPVEDGDTLALYKGPQGGYMIYFSVQARGFDRSRVNFCYVESFADTGKEWGNKCWLVQLTNDRGDGWYERVGIWGEVLPEYFTSPQKIRGKDAVIRATLTDEQGCSAEDGFNVHISLDPGR
jgi:hypothetical protein